MHKDKEKREKSYDAKNPKDFVTANEIKELIIQEKINRSPNVLVIQFRTFATHPYPLQCMCRKCALPRYGHEYLLCSTITVKYPK